MIHKEMEVLQKNALMEAASEHKKALAEREQQIIRLQEQAQYADEQRRHAIEQAVQEKQEQILRLQVETEKRVSEQSAALALAESNRIQQLALKDQEILRLQEQAKAAETEKILAITTAVQEKETEITQLQGQIVQEKQAAKIREQSLQEAHRTEVARLEAEVEQYRDFKLRQSTKMIGESLEQHCLTSFNQVRMMAFPRAYFEKDNEVVEGTKGDFVFREETKDGIPLLSIMFEMKNEVDTTEKKEYHDELYGFISFNQWMHEYENGKQRRDYIQIMRDGSRQCKHHTLSHYIRDIMHHPENKLNAKYSDEELAQSIEDMRTYIQAKQST